MLNPFNFKHYNLSEIVIYVDGQIDFIQKFVSLDSIVHQTDQSSSEGVLEQMEVGLSAYPNFVALVKL